MTETISQLREVSVRQLALLNSSGLAAAHTQLSAALANLTTPEFTVLFVGEYSRGKSMLLNALAGKEIFATSALPTPTVNVLRYADQPTAVRVVNNVPETVTLDVLLDQAADKSEVGLPIDLCRDQLVLMEFPSLSEPLSTSDINHAALRKAVQQADLIVVVLASDSLYSNTERGCVENELKPAGHTQIQFVCNSFDRLSPSNQKDIRLNAIQRLPAGPDSIFFTSALQTVESGTDTEDMARLRTTLTGLNSIARKRLREQRVHTLLEANLIALREYSDKVSKHRIDRKQASHQKVQEFMLLLNNIKTAARQATDELEVFRQQTRQVIESKTSTFMQELSTKIEIWLRSTTGETVDVSARFQEELRKWQDDAGVYLSSRLTAEQMALQASFGALQLHLQKLSEMLPSFSYPPTIKFDFPSDPTINVNVEIDNPNVPPRQSKAINIKELPEVLVVAVGAVVISFFWNPLVVIPAGLAVGGILIYSRLTGQRQQGIQDIQAYTIRLRKQSDEVVLQAARAAETYFAQVQKDVSTQIAEIVARAEGAVREHLNAQSSDSEPTDDLAGDIVTLERAIREQRNSSEN
jgi:Dynamin family